MARGAARRAVRAKRVDPGARPVGLVHGRVFGAVVGNAPTDGPVVCLGAVRHALAEFAQARPGPRRESPAHPIGGGLNAPGHCIALGSPSRDHRQHLRVTAVSLLRACRWAWKLLWVGARPRLRLRACRRRGGTRGRRFDAALGLAHHGASAALACPGHRQLRAAAASGCVLGLRQAPKRPLRAAVVVPCGVAVGLRVFLFQWQLSRSGRAFL